MILVTGAKGQLGSDVAAELNRRSIAYRGVDIVDMDITDEEAVQSYLAMIKPQSVIHCAAYTSVDNAEDEDELCMRINESGTEYLAKACRDIGAEMIYISTDYVFDGKGDMPYMTDATKSPLSVYGKSKLAGEEAVARCLDMYYIVRTSWVFGENGSNFVKTMQRLSQEREEINVVDDQIGSPTYTADLAVLLCDMAMSGSFGVYHATNEGFCSWAQFAQEIMRLSGSPCKINPIATEQYPTKAVRPKNSRLSKESLDLAGFNRLPEWEDALRRFLL